VTAAIGHETPGVDERQVRLLLGPVTLGVGAVVTRCSTKLGVAVDAAAVAVGRWGTFDQYERAETAHRRGD
jgi:hypothetical protein